MRERVPIIPVVSAGAHEQFIVLSRGEGLARLLRTRDWLRTESFPLVLALPWGLTSAYLPYWPLPTQIAIEFGNPFAIPAGEDPRDELAVSRHYVALHDRMQSTLDALVKGRFPVIGP